jgi:uncharacterized protein YggE
MKISLSILIFIFCVCHVAVAENLIRVKGRGEIKVTPDLALVSIEIWSRDADAKKTQASNAAELARVENILKDKFKVDDKDVQTTQINLNPEYRYENNGKRTLLGYQSNHGIQVTIKDLSKLGNLMDSLIGQSAEKFGTNIQSVSFSTAKKALYESECLALAVTNARSKADIIAKASKTSVKEIRTIIESSAGWEDVPQPMRGGMESFKSSALMSSAPPTNVSPGQITINTDVIADFSF